MLNEFEVFAIAKEFYWSCKALKLNRFLYDQLLRASSSIALNIAEGSGKRTQQDQARFYSIAFGSLRECQAILELEKINGPKISKEADRLGAMLYRLSKMEKNFPTNRTDNSTGTATDTATESENRTEDEKPQTENRNPKTECKERCNFYQTV